MGIQSDGAATSSKKSEGLGISIAEETEDELMSLDSSFQQHSDDIPNIAVDSVSSSDGITDEEDIADITPTIENIQYLDAKPQYERLDSAKTINSVITDDSDDIPQAASYTPLTRPYLARSTSFGDQQQTSSSAIAPTAPKSETSSNKSPLVKQGNQIHTGLKTISRFILPKLGAGSHTEKDSDDPQIDTQDGDINAFRSQRLLSKRKPPPFTNIDTPIPPAVASTLNDEASSLDSFSRSSSSMIKTDTDGDNHDEPIEADVDVDSVVDSIESSELVDSDYSYNSHSPKSDIAFNSYYDDNGGIVDDLDSDDYTNEDDLYDSFYDDDGMDTPGIRDRVDSLIGNTVPNSYTKSVAGGANGTNEISQINFKRLRPPNNKTKIGSRRDSNTLASSQMMKIDLDELRSRKNSNLKGEDQQDEIPISHFQFQKQDITSAPTTVTTGLSHLTELLHKTTINLNYYNYVGASQKVNDELVSIHVTMQNISLELKVNSSCQIVDLIGYTLYNFFKSNTNNGLDVKYQDPNYWKVFLVDSDGEIEDDFGSLDRKRLIKSYGGAEEFSIAQCSEDEYKSNEELTPSPLKGTNNFTNDAIPTANKDSNDIVPVDEPTKVNETGFAYNSLDAMGTLPSNLITPVGNGKQLKYPRAEPKTEFQRSNVVIEEEDSEEENESNDKVPEINNKYLRKNLTKQTTVISTGNHDKTKAGGSGLSKLKSSSKTIQSILHNTADHYQLTQEQLFNNTGGENEDGSNFLSTYHRWTIWRRQQMTFKNKQPKTLTVDGYQIYILPFNDLDGSWYESKTYSFNISQILKIKQSVKVPTHFKVVVNKNTNDGMVKKYYLEAKTESDCSAIVSTIRQLAKSMHQ